MTRTEAAQILGISPQAKEEAIKKAFRKKAMKLHPDRNKAANARSQFIEVHEAYEYLTDLATGRTTETYTSSSRHSHHSSKFRSAHHKHRHYADPYEHMSREEFEQRFNRARQAAEDALDRESNIIYQNSLDEYQDTWRKPLAKAMAVVGIVLALLFIVDYSLGLTEESVPDSEVKIYYHWQNHVAYATIEIYGNEYTLPNEAKYILKKKKDPSKIVIKGKTYDIPIGKRELSGGNNTIIFSINRTHIFKDIVGITIQSGHNIENLTPTYSAYNSFPIVPILLLLPLLSFWFEKPKFNFVFFAVNYNIYVFPIFVLILLFHDDRLMRLFGL